MKTTPLEFKKMYESGLNLTAFMREEMGLTTNTKEIVEIAYDLQAGSYVSIVQDKTNAHFMKNYCLEIAETIMSLCRPDTILEAGVGEATTLSGVLNNLQDNVNGFGFDLSWSRVAFAKRWLQSQNLSNTFLCTGDLFNIPFADDSIDVVYTSHSIEPNGGNEEPILRELFRVARKYLVLLEPSYELSNNEAKIRMEYHGYCRNLESIALSLGYNLIEHKLFPFTSNPLNPTALTIIKKDTKTSIAKDMLVCPRFKTRLEEIGNMLFSPEGLIVYPILGGIPCLRIENGIFASKYKEIMISK